MSKETANKGAANGGKGSTANRKEYMRELMRKKREAERLAKELVEDRVGDLDASEVVVKGGVGPALEGLTVTDQEFEIARPGYWIYGVEVLEKECWKCGEGFETRLEMNKFCSPSCKEQWLSDAFGKLRVR